MADTLHLEIVTAGGAAVDTQTQQVTLPLADGEAGILPGHAPLLGALVSGVVRYTSGGAEHYCAVSPGTVNVAANTVTVLARHRPAARRGGAAPGRVGSRGPRHGDERLHGRSGPGARPRAHPRSPALAQKRIKRREILCTVPFNGQRWGCIFALDMRKCLRIRLRRHFLHIFKPSP